MLLLIISLPFVSSQILTILCSQLHTENACVTNCDCAWCHNSSWCMYTLDNRECKGDYTTNHGTNLCQSTIDAWTIVVIVGVSILCLVGLIILGMFAMKHCCSSVTCSCVNP